ncbi:MAG: type II CRISPR RNA-guided endonuclease Cas9 [Chloroflexi bacterium]|nr:type II CRISPR RNA-guided endonuclease Cas9 [Chloroflexota bacterium]
MSSSVVNYRLGLDMGTNSIGWAAIKLDEQGKPCGILDLGVRIFPDGRSNPKDSTSASNAVQRRLARGGRRVRDRYLMRRSKLLNALVQYGLMPSDPEGRKRITADEKLDPYELRARALDRPLNPFELGRAIFHLNQRRGFKSNRNASGDNDNEAKQTRDAISELHRRIEESRSRTLGEYLHRRRKKRKPVRARPDLGLYPDRALYEQEFDAIRAVQQLHHAMNDVQWENLRETIFCQRPLKPVKPGWCTFEEGEHRAARALPLFQEFRMLQELANLTLHVGAESERRLSDKQRACTLERLQAGDDLNLDADKHKRIKNTLGFPSDTNFNLVAGIRTILKGDETTAKLRKPEMFDRKWLVLSLEERNDIVKFLIKTDDPEVVREKAVVEWGLTEEQAVAVSNVSLTSGYGNLSEKAIRKILPHLEIGKGYSEAVQAAGYDHHSDFRSEEAHDNLPYYGEILPRAVVGANPDKDPKSDGEAAHYGRIANPTVHIGLNQLRRVVNALIKTYGKPEDIVVELARDLKTNREQKRRDDQRRREGVDRNERLTEMLKSAEQSVSGEILRKLRLWDEQKKGSLHICPYTGRNISFEMAVSAQTEIDHILPFSRTLDDSMANKVVCIAAANRAKGNRTPYRAFGDNPPGYDYERIKENVANFPHNKRWRFQPDAMNRFEGENDFLGRQLSETRYLSRTARTYVAYLYDQRGEGKQRVRVIPGHMTALLRRGWGLEGMLSDNPDGEPVRKQRDDHRHHAIDAFVVANTTQGLFQEFSRAAGSSYQNAEERLASLIPPPWNGFDINELKQLLDNIVVSYRPDHGTRGAEARGATTGQLHNDTAYGIVELVEDGQSAIVVRKPLSSISRKALNDVRDTHLRAALINLWDEVGGNKARFAERAWSEGVEVNGRRQKVRSVRVKGNLRIIPIRDRVGNAYKGYLPGGNEFADVWQMRDGSWTLVVVPTFDANQPDFDIEKFRPTTSRGQYKGKPDPAAKRLMRLQIDDMGALGEGTERRIVRVRKITNNARQGGLVVLDDHNEANVPERVTRDARIRKDSGIDIGMKEEVYPASKLRRFGFRKIHVDEIGRVRDPGPKSS